MKKLLTLVAFLVASLAHGQTLTAVAVSPQGAVVRTGSTFQLSVTCTYSDASTDDCTKAGGPTWADTSPVTTSVSSSGLFTNIAFSSWTASTAYTAGQVVRDTNGNAEQANATGTSGASITWPARGSVNDIAQHVTSDGAISWTQLTGYVDPEYVTVTAGGLRDRAQIINQHNTDTWWEYISLDYLSFNTLVEPTPTILPMNIVVGATVAVGVGVEVNNDGSSGNQQAQPVSCASWTSSFPTVATVDRHGLTTAVSSTAIGDGGVAGATTITCNRAGDGLWGTTSGITGWQAPGNYVQLHVVNGGTSNQTWYVRPGGGLPYVNGTVTPHGQCDGKSDVDYDAGYPNSPWHAGRAYNLGDMIADTNGRIETVTTAGTSVANGSVVQHPTWPTTVGGTVTDGTVVWTTGALFPTGHSCAVGNLAYLYQDQASYETYGQGWMISGGDTVIVRQNTKGYDIGQANQGIWGGPSNCYGNGSACYMPTVPSGTPAQHTRILGENYASCSSDSAKTLLHETWGVQTAFNLRDSQYVDVACFELTDVSGCGGNNNFTNHCTSSQSQGAYGVFETGLTANVNISDLFIHGLSEEGIHGPTGVGTVINRVHLKGLPVGGVDMDDSPWATANLSLAGGLTMNNSITEFIGCIEEYPVVHNYPYIECRDQSAGGYADGFGTAAATGDWDFDHDIWRYNFQDGLDLLHSGLNSLTVTNSQSYGNDGQQFKIGSGATVLFQNNQIVHNCNRISQLFGDEPSSAIVPGITYCRASGDGIFVAIDSWSTIKFQYNSFAGYGATSIDMACVGGTNCTTANTIFQNNVFLGLANPNYGGGAAAALFYNQWTEPPHKGWATRDHNIYWGFRKNGNDGCTDLQPTEICFDPTYVNEPPLTLTTDESVLDNFNFHLQTGSQAIGTGVTIPALPVDIVGTTRGNPPSMGSLEFLNNPSTTSYFGGNVVFSGSVHF